jgi:O-acetylhomoserine (thiol)-lyase
MPIKIPSGLPAIDALEQEGVSVVTNEVALRQEVRPMKIALLNLMPNKERTETQFARLIGATPLTVELSLLRITHHQSKNAKGDHMASFYLPFAEARNMMFDGLIITGAPVETIPFEDVKYWDEMKEIFEWSQTHVHHTMAVCWGAMAMLNYFHNVPKYNTDKKRFGCCMYENLAPGSPFLRGFPDQFVTPTSRWSECRAVDLPTDRGLCILCNSDAAGLCLVEDPAHNALYMFNHFEYDTPSLKEEYDRDIKAGIAIHTPEHYYPNDDPRLPPINSWRGCANLLYMNWISEMFLTRTQMAVPAHTTNHIFRAKESDYDADRAVGEKFDTIMLHHGQTPNSDNRACAPPIYASSSFMFENVDQAKQLFALEKLGPIYTRIMNPTNHVLEFRIAKLEGSPCPMDGVQPSALVTSSGQAAQMHTFLTICQSGDNIVAASELYGGTYAQLKHSLPALGINVKFFDVMKPYILDRSIDEKTKAVYVETIANPSYNIPDFERLAKICAKHKVPLIVDNTFGMCGYVCRPFKFGANIIVESCTKWIGGHGNTIGGVIVDGCNFDWGVKLADGTPKFPRIAAPVESYHGLNFWDQFGPSGPLKVNMAFIFAARLVSMRDMGSCQNPFGSFLLLNGLETLSLRGKSSVENTNRMVAKLADHDKVAWVSHPSIMDHPSHKMSKKYFRPGTFGAVFSFGVKGGFEAAKSFIDHVKLSKHLANVGDAKTLVLHPASTTHAQLSEAERIQGGVPNDMIRVSMGFEDIGDILSDFEQALANVITDPKSRL